MIFDWATFFAWINMLLSASSIVHGTKSVRSTDWFVKTVSLNVTTKHLSILISPINFFERNYQKFGFIFTTSKAGILVIWQITIWFDLSEYISVTIVSRFLLLALRKILARNYIYSLNGMQLIFDINHYSILCLSMKSPAVYRIQHIY